MSDLRQRQPDGTFADVERPIERRDLIPPVETARRALMRAIRAANNVDDVDAEAVLRQLDTAWNEYDRAVRATR